jgi:hypothetical protein
LFQPPALANDPVITSPAFRSNVGWAQFICNPCTCPAQQVSLGQLMCRFR